MAIHAKYLFLLLASLALWGSLGCKKDHPRIEADAVEIRIYSGGSVMMLRLLRDGTLTGGWGSLDHPHPNLISEAAAARVFALADDAASAVTPGTYYMPASHHEPCLLLIQYAGGECAYILNEGAKGRPEVPKQLLDLVLGVSGLTPW
jgi:hypothetical protein